MAGYVSYYEREGMYSGKRPVEKVPCTKCAVFAKGGAGTISCVALVWLYRRFRGLIRIQGLGFIRVQGSARLLMSYSLLGVPNVVYKMLDLKSGTLNGMGGYGGSRYPEGLMASGLKAQAAKIKPLNPSSQTFVLLVSTTVALASRPH